MNISLAVNAHTDLSRPKHGKEARKDDESAAEIFENMFTREEDESGLNTEIETTSMAAELLTLLGVTIDTGEEEGVPVEVYQETVELPSTEKEEEFEAVSTHEEETEESSHDISEDPDYVQPSSGEESGDDEIENADTTNQVEPQAESGAEDSAGNESDRDAHSMTGEPPRKRSRKANPKTWKQNMNKYRREKGEAYEGSKKINGNRQKVGKQARKLKDRCTCKEGDTLKCKQISNEQRNEIFNKVWKMMKWPERKTFVQGLVDAVPTARKRTSAENSHRKMTLMYHLKIQGERKRVCKKMFLCTTGLGRFMVHKWATENNLRENVAGRVRSPHYDRAEEARVFMRSQFLEVLPKMPSHYCRASTQKQYLEPVIASMTDLHKLYTEKCKEHDKQPLSRQVLVDEFQKMNLSLFSPKKDQCDICVGHEAGHVSEDDWVLHRQKKDAARQEKTNDKEMAIECLKAEYEGKQILVTCMDMQAVLLAPRLQASALYYKQKLCVHNFTIFNLATHEVVCYVWHEGEGGLTSSEFVSCIIDFLTTNQDNDEFILYSDGCGYQNRNVVLSNALLQFAKTHNKVVVQKILEKGHTQMEVDSAHAKIEQKLRSKGTPIYVPANYIDIIKKARDQPEPYKVKYLDHTFFKDFSKIGPFKSIRPGSKVGDSTVSDIRALQYSSTGISYKLQFSDEWKSLPQPRAQNFEMNTPPLFTQSRKIVPSKFKNLQELKSVIPADFHGFYDNLRS